MKLVLIHGQNHRGSSYHIGRILAEKLAKEEEITEIFLPRDLDHHCLGCYACIRAEAQCPFYAEKQVIAEAMEKAEVLIFTTPTYCMAPSGPMKDFMDLFFQYWIPHRPRKQMFSKKAVVITTAAGNGMREAIKPVRRMLAYWGVPYIRTYGMAVQASVWSEVTEEKRRKIEGDMTVLAGKIRRAAGRKPSPYIRFLFGMMANIRKKNPDYMPEETAWWRENGLLEKERPWKN